MKNRFLSSYLFLFVAMLGFLPPLPAQSFEIHLNNRSFTPNPATSLESVSLSQAQHYVLLQFNNPLNGSLLAGAGLPCLGRVDDYTVMSRVPAGFSFRDIPDLRYAGKLDAEDRLSATVREQLGESKAGTHTVLLYTMEAFTAAEKGSLLQSAAASEAVHPDVNGQRMLVTGTTAAVEQLMQDERVAWIAPATQDLRDGKRVHFCEWGVEASPCDNVPFATPGENPVGPPATIRMGSEGWDGPGRGCAALKYHFVNRTEDLPLVLQQEEIRRSLDVWAHYVDVTFTETFTAGQNRTLDIRWTQGTTSNALGTGLGPSDDVPEPQAGDITLNDGFTWYIYPGVGEPAEDMEDIRTIVLHEIGHALGLGHSNEEDAIMHSPLGDKRVQHELHLDDIERIKALYHASGWEHEIIGRQSFWFSNPIAGDLEVAPNGQIRYRTEDGKMGNMYMSGGFWQQAIIEPNWTTSAENIKAGGSIAMNQSSGQTFYHGEDNKLQAMRWSNGAWHHDWIDADWNDSQWDVAGEIEVDPGNGQVRHRAPNGRIINKYWNSTTGWNTVYLGPNNASPLTRMKAGGSIAINAQHHTYYHGVDNRVQQFYWSDGTWKHAWVGADWTSNSRDVIGDIEVAPNGQVFYHGTGDKLHQLYWSNGNWHHAIVAPDWTSNYWNVAGDIEVSPSGQVRYRIPSGEIANIYWSSSEGTWKRGLLEPYWGGSNRKMVDGGAMAIGPDGRTYYHGKDRQGTTSSEIQSYFWVSPCPGKAENDAMQADWASEPTGSAAPEFRAFPNPFRSELTLQLELAANTTVSVEVLDLQGRRVRVPVRQEQKIAGTHTFVLDTEALPAGMYFARLQYGDAVRSVKVLRVD